MSPQLPKRRARRCPICSRPPDTKFKPFCSKRCADLDLARWLDGKYAIPTGEADDRVAGSGEENGEG